MKEIPFSPFSEIELKNILNFDPVEKLGQNFLIDPDMVQKVVNSTIIGADVVEIGCGPGNITKGIAKRASSVIGLEIFPNFYESQQTILEGCENIEIINQNALKFNFNKWINSDREARHQVIGNIPFHISEPLLTKLAMVSDNIENIILLVGDNLASIMTSTNPYDDHFSRLSFISSIFDINRTAHVPKNHFWPQPRTDADIISLASKEYPDSGSMSSLQLRKKIVLSQAENLTIIKILNNFSTGSEKEISHRYDRRQIKNELKKAVYELNSMPVNRREISSNSRIGKMGSLASRIELPKEILSKPFSQLNNEEVRQLAIAIDRL
jgi:16S rRNA (adenine1518-N6/adenine1519-N6)-dimethyltransferase